ncbi:MAG: radical SAM protein, partial [Thermodesulfobacteriota bacterium]
MDRRCFLKWAGLAAAGTFVDGWPLTAWGEQDAAPVGKRPGGAARDDEPYVHPAMFWDKLGGGKVQCRLCPRECVVMDGRRGHCGVRENRGGEYFTLVYGRVIMPQNDPIEKKPFNHFLPGTTVLSTAT